MRRRLTLGVSALAALATLAACSSSSKTASPSASTTTTVGSAAPAAATSPSPSTTAPSTAACNRPHAAGQSTQTFTFQGKPRTFELYVPPSYDGTKNVPVLFNFHGFGSNAKEEMAYTNFMPIADREGFIIVAADGQGAARHYNLTGEGNLQNDITMVGGLIDHIEQNFCVDAKRLYSTGMSDGGAMTSLLACNMSDKFAAYAPVAVIISLPVCARGRNIDIVGFHGTADPVVPYAGGRINCCGNFSLPSSPTAMAGWAAHDDCSPNYTEVRLSSEVRKRTWNGCKAGSDVVFYSIDGGGHTWPGSAVKAARLGHTTDQIDASETIWKFLSAHQLQ